MHRSAGVAIPFWSTSRCKGAARTARTPGAFWTGSSNSHGCRLTGFSGTSAGAMNAAALVYGHSLGGNDGARTVLETVWRRVSEAGLFSAAHLYIFIRKAVDQSGISAVVTGVSMCPKLSTDPS